MADIPNVCLNLSNRPENVLVVRQALTGVAEHLGLDAVETNDLNTAATEACNNVVQHAYEGAEGPLEVEVYAQPGTIEVVVRDHGVGIRPHAEGTEDAHAGIGLPVIHALTQRVEFRNLPGGGTEVGMEFPAPRATLEPLHDGGREARATMGQLNSTVEMTLAPSTLAQAVLPRVLSALAARAYFSTDRISDLQLVADTLVANFHDSISGSHLGVAVTLSPRNLELNVGPLRTGSARRLIDFAAADGLGAVLQRLTDEHRVSESDAAEMLALRLVEPR
jgi:anti-sigma regulatory factor (Ser/Thr protein kinase)